MHLSALATLTGIVQDEACDDGIFIREAVPLRQCLLVAPLPPTLDSPALRRSKLRWPQIQQEPHHERPPWVITEGEPVWRLLCQPAAALHQRKIHHQAWARGRLHCIDIAIFAREAWRQLLEAFQVRRHPSCVACNRPYHSKYI